MGPGDKREPWRVLVFFQAIDREAYPPKANQGEIKSKRVQGCKRHSLLRKSDGRVVARSFGSREERRRKRTGVERRNAGIMSLDRSLLISGLYTVGTIGHACAESPV